MKKLWIVVSVIAVLSLAGCEAGKRWIKDLDSAHVGLDRRVEVYDHNGNLLKVYEGKIDVEANDYGNKVKFDLNGKRIIINNAIVIIEEK
ncbi:MAG: DUF5052 family protein [Firmicutes bacterium]|nr:DUF5052 family protein [Bacillota bacterium]